MPPMRISEGIHDSAAWISGGGTLRDRENHHTTRRARLRHPRHTTPMRIRHGDHDPPTWVPDIQAHNPSARPPPHGRRPPTTPNAAFQEPAEQGKPGPYRPRPQAASDGTTAPPFRTRSRTPTRRPRPRTHPALSKQRWSGTKARPTRRTHGQGRRVRLRLAATAWARGRARVGSPSAPRRSAQADARARSPIGGRATRHAETTNGGAALTTAVPGPRPACGRPRSSRRRRGPKEVRRRNGRASGAVRHDRG